MDLDRIETVWAEIERWDPAWVVFDVGAVLVEWDPERPYRALIPDAGEREAFFARADLGGMNLAGDHGRLEEAVERWVARHPEDAALIRVWRARWGEMFGPAIPETEVLLRRARESGRRVAALSNFAADTWEIGRGMFEVLRGFDVEVISGREGVAKPAAEIYARVEAATGAEGRALWFLDDRAENVAAARARGWGGMAWPPA